MTIRVDKTQESGNRAAGNAAPEGKADLQFSDQRSETITLRKLSDTANNGAGAKQLRTFQAIADNGSYSNAGDRPLVQRKIGYDTKQGDYFIEPWKKVYSVSPFLKELNSDPTITLNVIADQTLKGAHGTTQLVHGGTKPTEPGEWYEYFLGEPLIEMRIGPHDSAEKLLETMLHECYLHVAAKFNFLKEGRRICTAMQKAEDNESEQEKLFKELEGLFSGDEEHKNERVWFTLLLAAYDLGCFKSAVLDCAWDYHLGVKKAVELENAVKEQRKPVQVIQVQDVFQYSQEQLRLLMQMNNRVIAFEKGGKLGEKEEHKKKEDT